MLDEQSGERLSPKKRQTNSWYPTGKNNSVDGEAEGYGDKGGASRFFYVAKASRAERNMGCEGLKEKQQNSDTKIRTYNDRCATCGKKFVGSDDTICHCSKGEKITDKTVYTNKNNHPTVKPLKLMEYLCILTKTPTGGIILDPFAGSGSTLIAAKRTGRPFIGIEKEPEYIKIAEARIKAQPEPLL